MSYNLSNDASAASGPIFPGISTNHLRRIRQWCLAITALVFLSLFLWWIGNVYTDWLWFGQLGFRGVYTKILVLKVWLFMGGTLVSSLALVLSLYLTVRFSRGQSTLDLPPSSIRLLWAIIIACAALTTLIAGPTFGAAASGRWEIFLLFFNRVSFGVTDPQFGLDISFYVVTLRLLNFIQGWVLALTITVSIASLTLYAAIFALRGIRLVLTPRMLNHVAILGLVLMLAIAAKHALDIYGLVLSSGGIVAGATYTDVNARIPALWFLTVIAVLAAAGFGVSRYVVGLRLMAGSFSLWVIMALLAGVAYPALFQRLQVAPDEFSRE